MIWEYKGCSRCHGDIYLEKDYDGWYEVCLQCGAQKSLNRPPVFMSHRQLNNIQVPGIDRPEDRVLAG